MIRFEQFSAAARSAAAGLCPSAALSTEIITMGVSSPIWAVHVEPEPGGLLSMACHPDDAPPTLEGESAIEYIRLQIRASLERALKRRAARAHQ